MTRRIPRITAGCPSQLPGLLTAAEPGQSWHPEDFAVSPGPAISRPGSRRRWRSHRRYRLRRPREGVTDAGLVTSNPVRCGTRGRPRRLYTPASRAITADGYTGY